MARRRTVSKDRAPRADGRGGRLRRLRPARAARAATTMTPVDGMTATVMTRLDSFRRDDDGRIVNATDPWFLTAGRDRRPPPGARVRPLPRRPGARLRARVAGRARDRHRRPRDAARLRRLPPDRATTSWPAGPSTTRSACAAPRSRTTTAATARPGGTCRTAPTVGIPYRTLVVRDAANVLVAGRCFSATHDAHASVRSMAQCMAMGQAAGTAAALAVVGRHRSARRADRRPPRSPASRRRDPRAPAAQERPPR